MPRKKTHHKTEKKEQRCIPEFFVSPVEKIPFTPRPADFVWNSDIPKKLSPFARIRKKYRRSPKRLISLVSVSILAVEALLLLGFLFQAIFGSHLPVLCGADLQICHPEISVLLLFCIPAAIAATLLLFPERFFGKSSTPSLLSEQKDTFEILQAKKRSADTLAELGEYHSALVVYEEILREDPGFGETRIQAANVLAGMGETKKALHYFEEATHMGLGKEIPFFAQGTVFLREKTWEKALSFLSKACQIAPKKEYILRNLGITLLESSQYETAHEVFHNAVSLFPHSLECLFGEVLSLFHLEQYEEAQKIVRQLLQKQPKDERFLFAGGVLALKHNDWERAAQYFSAFLLQNHEPEIARIFRGNALVALQHFSQAEEEFRTLSKDNFVARQNLAGVLFLLKNYEEALPLYESLPESPEILLQRVECRSALGEGNLLLKAIQKAVQKTSHSARLFLLEGNAYLREKNIQKAFRSFEKAIAFNEQCEEAWFRKGELLLEHFGNPREAEICFRRTTEENPQNADAWYKRGMCLFLSEQPKEAEKVFETALELNPKQSLAHFHRGVSLLQIGNSKKAVESFRAFLKKNPNDPEALYNMGIALAELGKHQEALEMYEKILAIHPAYLSALINKGNALFALGDYQGAVRAYDEALSHNERDAFAHYNKACALNLLKNRDLALRELEMAMILDGNLREEARKEESFKNIRRLKIFRMIVGLA